MVRRQGDKLAVIIMPYACLYNGFVVIIPATHTSPPLSSSPACLPYYLLPPPYKLPTVFWLFELDWFCFELELELELCEEVCVRERVCKGVCV